MITQGSSGVFLVGLFYSVTSGKKVVLPGSMRKSCLATNGPLPRPNIHCNHVDGPRSGTRPLPATADVIIDVLVGLPHQCRCKVSALSTLVCHPLMRLLLDQRILWMLEYGPLHVTFFTVSA